MGNFFSQHKGIIIGVFLTVLIFIGYAIIRPKVSSNSSGLQKTIVNNSISSTVTTSADDPGAGFVQQLLAIQNIKFDTAFFADPVYKDLVDQSRPLGNREVGRPNPFLDIGVDTIINPDLNPKVFVPTATSSASSTTSKAKTPSR